MSLLNTTAQRPRPHAKGQPASPLEWILEAASVGILLFWLFYLTSYWDSLPESVPSGFDFAGRPRGPASKSLLWLLPGMGVVIYGFLTFMSRFPHLYNFPVEVTATNAGQLYSLARWQLRLLKFEVVALLGYLEWKMVQTGRGDAAGVSPWYLPIVLAVVFATSVYPIIRMRRYQEQ